MVKEFRRLTLSWMDPHTTTAKGRGCKDCHADPMALGLGQGSLQRTAQGWRFESALSPSPDLLGIDHPLDGLVDIQGRALVHTSRPWLRPFNREEIQRILDVGPCLPCHHRLNDPAIRDWRRHQGLRACPHG